jgi:DNA helicase TIP49 (TBP-interacting protein)
VFTVLLSGPTGTGKTEMAKATAAYLFGDENRMFASTAPMYWARPGRPDQLAQGFCRIRLWGALTRICARPRHASPLR